MAGRLHRIQYACNLPTTLLGKTAGEYLTPCAPTLLVLGHMMYPDFFRWCGKHWKDVVYAPFGTQGPGTETILQYAGMLHPPFRLAHFLPKENVAFVLASNRHRNQETYQYWTYRGASVVLVSQGPLGFVPAPAPAAHVFANGTVAANHVANGMLSVCNPAFSHGEGMRVANYDRAAFVEVRTKNEQGCEVIPEVAQAGAALYPAEVACAEAACSVNLYDPLK